MTWAVVVPVKRLAVAKTRLRTERYADPARHAAVVLAMAVDTVAAALAADGVALVVVVTDDPVAGSALREVGAVVVADEPGSGLNPALGYGASHARSGGDVGVASLSSDLPALRATELAAVLVALGGAARGSGVVADATGTGTTLLAAGPGVAFAPSYGEGSFARHLAAGARDLTSLAGPGLRRDVDTTGDLAAAASLGLGPASRKAALERQGTIRTVDGSGAGTIFLDDGTVVAFDSDAVRVVRRLRTGQRVRLAADGPVASALTIVSLPLPSRW